MYKLLLTTRYLLRKWIALFAVLSVWACVAMVLIVFSVMDGFLDNIKKHSRGLLSDIVVDNSTLQGFPYYDDFTEYLKQQMPDTVEYVAPVIYNYAVLRVRDASFTKPVQVIGIDLETYCAVNTFKQSLYYEKFYPGTTTLGDVQVPIAGEGANSRYLLPSDHEEAFTRFNRENPNDPDLKELQPTISSPHGVGHFEQRFGEPGYDGTPRPGVIVGTDLLYERKQDGHYYRSLPRGAEIILNLLPLTPRGAIVKEPIPAAVRYVDDSRTKVYEIDSKSVYVDFAKLQHWLDMGPLERADGTMTKPRASQLLIQLKGGIDAKVAREQIDDAWGRFQHTIFDQVEANDAMLLSGVKVETWQERQRPFISAVEKEKVLVTTLFGVISMVAVVMISVVFYMAVIQKTRDIGVIKSLGATRLGVAGIFLMYGAAIGVVGGLLGILTGSIFVQYINEIQDLLATMNPELRVWSPDVYTFDRIPSEIKPAVMAWVLMFAVLFSTLGSLIPAIKAASVWPVKALRYE